MADHEKRKMMEYQARAILNAVADVPRREVIVGFKGEENEEEYDLAIRLPVGAVGALVMQLHKACAEMDRSTADKAVIAQPISLSGAQASNPLDGLPTVILSLGGFQIPAVMPSKQAVLQIRDELDKCLEDGGSRPRTN